MDSDPLHLLSLNKKMSRTPTFSFNSIVVQIKEDSREKNLTSSVDGLHRSLPENKHTRRDHREREGYFCDHYNLVPEWESWSKFKSMEQFPVYRFISVKSNPEVEYLNPQSC